MGRRILVTGPATLWGAQLVRWLEADPEVDVIVGLDIKTPGVRPPATRLPASRAPTEVHDRIEHVRTEGSYAALASVVRATQVDTIVHTSLVVDSTGIYGQALHEVNVIGTMNLLAAATAGTSVRQVVVTSSTLVYGSGLRDPVWPKEDMVRSSPARNQVERSLVEVERNVGEFAHDNPATLVSLLRLSDVLGPDVDAAISRCLGRGIAPCIAGFDPLVQFVEQQDALRALEMVVGRQIPGTYNVAGDGRLPWSEVASICGARLTPLPPVLTGPVAAALTRTGLLDIPPEMVTRLRYGGGVDNQALKETGFTYRFTSAGAVERLAAAAVTRPEM